MNTSRWDGWVQSPIGTGSAIYSVDNIDSYLNRAPEGRGGDGQLALAAYRRDRGRRGGCRHRGLAAGQAAAEGTGGVA